MDSLAISQNNHPQMLADFRNEHPTPDSSIRLNFLADGFD
jgi:hypothetical protein